MSSFSVSTIYKQLVKLNAGLLSNLCCWVFIFRLSGTVRLAEEVVFRERAGIAEGRLLHRRDGDVLSPHLGERHHVLTLVLQGENQIQPNRSSTTTTDR